MVEKSLLVEFRYFLTLLQQGRPFAFVRYNDGECNVLKSAHFACKQWQLDASSAQFRTALAHGLRYQHPSYYLGIPCGCSELRDGFRAFLQERYAVFSTNTTFATLFCNAMFPLTQRYIFPLFRQYPLVLIANEHADIASLRQSGYAISHFIPIPMNAWRHYHTILDQCLSYIREHKPEGFCFIFAAGPVTNILIHQLHALSPHNTYIDVGSTFDKAMGLTLVDRCYHSPFNWKSLASCYWSSPVKGMISCDTHSKSKLYRFYLRLYAFCKRVFCTDASFDLLGDD